MAAARTAPKKPTPNASTADRSARQVNMSDLSKLLNRDRSTIYKWLDVDRWPKGGSCPYLTKADKASGSEWTFDLAEVVKWRERVVVDEALRDAVGEGLSEGEEILGPEGRMKLALLAVKLLREQSKVVLVDEVHAMWGRAYGLIRQSIMALPVKLIRRVPGLDRDTVLKLNADCTSDCADALEAGNQEIVRAIEEARESRRVAEFLRPTVEAEAA